MMDKIERKIIRVEITADKHIKHDFTPTEIKEIGVLSGKIRALRDDFDRLYSRIIAEMPPWPKTQYEQSPGIRRRRRDRKIES
jgi:hypothetical protein